MARIPMLGSKISGMVKSSILVSLSIGSLFRLSHSWCSMIFAWMFVYVEASAMPLCLVTKLSNWIFTNE